MNDTDIFITVEELQIVLNLLGPQVTVEFPPYDLVLLEARQQPDGYHISQIVSADKINTCAELFSHPEFFDYQAFVQCFLSSGISPYQNLENVKEMIQMKKQALSSFKELFYVLDTNLFYDKVISTYELVPATHVCLVDTVLQEILYHLNNKFDKSFMLDALKSLVLQYSSMAETAVDHTYNEFVNRNMKMSRIAKNMAQKEYIYIRKYGKEIPIVKNTAKTSRENDQLIAEIIKEFQQESPYNEILLLTADTAMKDVCDIVGVESLVLQKPTSISSKHCSMKNSTILFSEYQGGDQQYPLKIRLLNQTYYKEVEKHIKLCRRLQRVEQDQGGK